MTAGAVCVIGLAKRRDAIFLLKAVAFQAGLLVPFDVCELTGFNVRRVMTLPAAAIFQFVDVVFMGKTDLRSSQFTEDIFVGQNIFLFLGHRILPPDSANQNQTDDERYNRQCESHNFPMRWFPITVTYHSRALSTLPNSAPMYAREKMTNSICPSFVNGMAISRISPASICRINMGR